MTRFSHYLLVSLMFTLSLNCFSQQSAKPSGSVAVPPPAAAPANAPSEATVNEFLKHMFGWNNQVTWKVAQIKAAEDPSLTELIIILNTPQGQQLAHLYVTPDQKFALSGELVPFGSDPFAPAREMLKGINGPAHGPKGAPVTIVEFGDLECPACKAAQPNVTKLMEDEPNAQLVFQNFPLEQHKWAPLGAKYLDCIGRENTCGRVEVYSHGLRASG